MELGARPCINRRLRKAWTSMFRHSYNWNIVECDIKQTIQRRIMYLQVVERCKAAAYDLIFFLQFSLKFQPQRI